MTACGESYASSIPNCYVINAVGIVGERGVTDGCVSAATLVVIKRANTGAVLAIPNVFSFSA